MNMGTVNVYDMYEQLYTLTCTHAHTHTRTTYAAFTAVQKSQLHEYHIIDINIMNRNRGGALMEAEEGLLTGMERGINEMGGEEGGCCCRFLSYSESLLLHLKFKLPLQFKLLSNFVSLFFNFRNVIIFFLDSQAVMFRKRY